MVGTRPNALLKCSNLRRVIGTVHEIATVVHPLVQDDRLHHWAICVLYTTLLEVHAGYQGVEVHFS